MSFARKFPVHVLPSMRVTTAKMLLLAVGCGNGETRESGLTNWITVPEYQFGDDDEGDVILQRPLVRADSPRNRILVLDPRSSQVSEWTPGGSLGFVVGRRGQGPGDFASPQDLFVEADGSFSVLEDGGSRFTYFSAGGDLVESIQGPGGRVGYQGFRVALAWPRNGVHLGVPRLPAGIELGHRGDTPVELQPLLRVRMSDDGEWLDPEPLLWLDMRNKYHFVRHGNGTTSYGSQPFGDADEVWFEPGAAVVVRTREAPGAVELIEVDETGDTVWHRDLRFEPARLTAQIVEDQVHEFLDATADQYETLFSISRQQLRNGYYEGLYRPEYLPAADGRPVLSASGDVWIRTHELTDTLRTHYVVRRGDANEEPRRVLLPEWLRISDATETHVWGIWYDSMDVPHIVGRRLVRMGAIE